MLLGTVRIRRGDEMRVPPTGLMRALLAALALADGETTARALLDAVWRSEQSSEREATVAVAVHRLRRWMAAAVGDEARVDRLTSGYRLEIRGGSTDVARFRGLVGHALRTDDDERRAALLSAALAVWRGPALDDVPSRYAGDDAVLRLENERLACTVELGRSLLRSGQPVRAVQALEAAARRHPLDELIQGLLIEVLGAAGRPADACGAYRLLRSRLVEELGVEPGPAVHEAYLKVLNGEAVAVPPPGRPPVPAQLPADVIGFTGREALLRLLDHHAGRHGASSAGVSLVVGTAGVGKTALVRHWAHRVRDRYPDGQLFVDLRGYTGEGPRSPIDVLGAFLRALGVVAERVPASLDEAAAAYRTLLAERRMLVVLDNARSAAQVRPLLPGGTSCHVVVTSRDSLTGLVAVDGARSMVVEPLTAGQARRLMIELLGEGRVRAEAAAAEALARSCAHLPLALRIVCADLGARPDAAISDKVAALGRDDPLAQLTIPGDDQPGVAAAIRHSYDTLPPDAQRLFQLIGSTPVHDVTASAAAALAGLDEGDCRTLLRRLADACLIEEQRAGRYSLHDLLQAFAAHTAAVDARTCEAAVMRLLDWYVNRADVATRRLYPHVWRMTPGTGAGDGLDPVTALHWLDDERLNLVACARHAAARGPGAYAWRIADATRGYVWHGAHLVEWRALAEAGWDAAQHLDDRYAQAAMSQSLAFLATTCHAPDALDRYEVALDLSRRCGWREGEALALGNLGRTLNDRGQLARAITCLEQAMAIGAEVACAPRLAADTGNLAIVLAESGQLRRAGELHARALTMFRELGAAAACATALNNLAAVRWASGFPGEALPLVEESIARHREAGARVGEAYGLGLLANVVRDLGDRETALRHARAGLVLIRTAGDDRNQAEILNILGSLHLARHDPRTAWDCYRRAAAAAAGAVSPLPALQALVGLATAEHQLGRWTTSRGLLRRALAGSRKCGYRLVTGHAWTSLARLEMSRGRTAEARAAAEHALAVQRETGHRIVDADPGPVLLRLAATAGHHQ